MVRDVLGACNIFGAIVAGDGIAVSIYGPAHVGDKARPCQRRRRAVIKKGARHGAGWRRVVRRAGERCGRRNHRRRVGRKVRVQVRFILPPGNLRCTVHRVHGSRGRKHLAARTTITRLLWTCTHAQSAKQFPESHQIDGKTVLPETRGKRASTTRPPARRPSLLRNLRPRPESIL